MQILIKDLNQYQDILQNFKKSEKIIAIKKPHITAFHTVSLPLILFLIFIKTIIEKPIK